MPLDLLEGLHSLDALPARPVVLVLIALGAIATRHHNRPSTGGTR